MWVQVGWIESHQVYNVDDTHFKFGDMVTQPPGGGNRFQRRYIACTGHDDIGFYIFIITGPVPR